MLFLIKEFEMMQNELKTKVDEVLIRNHNRRYSENITTIEGLKEPRRQQAQFLYKVIERLKDYKPEKMADKLDKLPLLKAKILTGCLYIIWDEILESYTWSPPTNSDLFTILSEVIGIKSAEEIDLHSKHELMSLAENFLRNQIAVEADFTKGFRPDQPFKYPGFLWTPIITRIIRIKGDAAIAESTAAEEAYLKAQQPLLPLAEPASLSVFGSLASFFVSAAPEASKKLVEETINPGNTSPESASS